MPEVPYHSTRGGSPKQDLRKGVKSIKRDEIEEAR